MKFKLGLIYIIILMGCLLFIHGCSQDRSVNKEKYASIKLDMTLDQVEGIMGGPGEIKTFEGQKENSQFYRWEDPNNSNYIYVGIVNGRVASISSPF